MDRTITVKGTGKASAPVDLVNISLNISALDKNYEKASDIASEKLEALGNALEAAGFKKEALKTSYFNVSPEYDGHTDPNGIYVTEFTGYRVSHDLSLAFDFSNEALAKAVAAISGCTSEPSLSISFTVKDKDALEEQLLASAAENAKKKALILCSASGVVLGNLLSINYDWSQIDVYSQSRCNYDSASVMCAKSMEINPEDVSMSDSASFVWEIRAEY